MQLPPTPTRLPPSTNVEVAELAEHLSTFDIWEMSPTAIQYWNSLEVISVVFQVILMITIVSAGVMRQIRQLSTPDETPPNAP